MSKADFFEAVQLWVHVVGLKMHQCTQEVGQRVLAEMEGLVAEIREEQNTGIRFIRILIQHNITVPFRRVLQLEIDGTLIKTLLQYERLPNMCFHYGLVNHTLRFCPLLDHKLTVEEKNVLPYGSWLGTMRRSSLLGEVVVRADEEEDGVNDGMNDVVNEEGFNLFPVNIREEAASWALVPYEHAHILPQDMEEEWSPAGSLTIPEAAVMDTQATISNIASNQNFGPRGNSSRTKLSTFKRMASNVGVGVAAPLGNQIGEKRKTNGKVDGELQLKKQRSDVIQAESAEQAYQSQ